jgi:site-specific DNA recombinase
MQSKRAAIYLRQSMDKEEGIESQRKRAHALAVARGWEVVVEFVDNNVKASKSRDTAEWAELVRRSKAGDFEVVVATKMDRLARRVRDILELSESGLGITTVEGELDTTTEMGKFQAVLLTALAELEIGRKGQRHKEAHADRAARGIPRTTKRPYGWKSDGMTLELREAAHLRAALRNILAGRSIRGEAARMNRAGQRTPTYKSGSGGKLWDAKSLTSVLDRPRMAGINAYLGEETQESRIQPVVSREDWEAYRALRKNQDRLTRLGSSDLSHYLTGVAECACGEQMRSRTVTSRGKKVPYYECKNRDAKDGKKHTAIAAHLVEVKVEAFLYGHMSGGWTRAGGTGEKVKTIRAALAGIAEDRAAATEALLTKGVDKGPVRVRLAKLDLEARSLEAELEKALSDDWGADWLDALMAAGEDSYESAEAFKTWFDGLTPEQRRALVRGNFTVKVGPGQGVKRVRVDPR